MEKLPSGTTWEESFDLVVIGSGAGGMSTALAGSTLGLRVLVVEKTAHLGGGCAISGGVIWVPNNSLMPQLGLSDSESAAQQYLRALLGPNARWDMVEAYLANAPAMLDFLHNRTSVRLVARKVAPDYYPDKAGAATGGRMLDPAVFDGRSLGPWFRKLRPPLPSFLLFGGMMVAKADIAALLSLHKDFRALRHAVKLLTRYLHDRLRYSRGTRLVVGNALAASLLKACLEAGTTFWLEATATGLVRDGDRISGAVIARNGVTVRVRARKAVVLACGGAPGDPEFARAHVPYPEHHHSMAPSTNSGEGIRLGISAGGSLDTVNRDAAFWTPVSRWVKRDGEVVKFAHLITDRQKPGLVAVNHSGKRFTNESASYHEFVVGMHAAHRRSPSIPAYMICDARFIRRYGLGLVRPGIGSHRRFIKDGYLIRARSLDALAGVLDIPKENLRKTVAANNEYAETGVDLEFGRGASPYDRYLGDPDHSPNPCIGPIRQPPFYAVRVYPGDIGTSLGLRVDAHARVLGPKHEPIAGLYACGNDMNSVMSGTYPSGGITLGPAFTFGFIIARDLAQEATPSLVQLPQANPQRVRAQAS